MRAFSQSNNQPWGSTTNSQSVFDQAAVFGRTNSSSSSSLDSYLSTIQSLIQSNNGRALSRHLSFRQSPRSQIFQQISNANLRDACKSQFQHLAPWNQILPQHLQSHLHAVHSRHLQSWKAALSALKAAKEQLIAKANGISNIWYLSVINTILKHCSECAIVLHSKLNESGSDDDNIDPNRVSKREVIGDTVNELFLIIRAVNSSKHQSMSRALFFTVNQVIRLCDIINNPTFINQSLQEVKQFENRWHEFPCSEIVTHLYYKGRHNIQGGNVDLVAAKRDLQEAYRMCLDELLNKTRILLLLIPIQMILGFLPDLNALAPPLRLRFDPIVCALKTGNLLLFKKAMDHYQDDFIHCGIYLMLCKLELLVFRALVMKVFVTRQRMMDKGANKMKLREIKSALQIRSEQYRRSKYRAVFEGERKQQDEQDGEDVEEMMVEEIDEDEIECLLTTLIWKKLIQGYVAHGIACVLSSDPNKAFPPIKQCKKWWINDF